MRRAILIILATLSIILVGGETFARLIVERHSKVQVMVNQDFRDALSIRQGAPGKPKQLLVVGNSMVGMDLDFPVLQRQLAPEWNAHRYWIYNTNYSDWYYGVKQLLEKGSRPDAIAVIVGWNAQGIRGDYSSYYLFQPSDLPALQQETHLDNTATANLLFARYSRFYGLRSEIRKVLLQSLFPDLPRMYLLFRPRASKDLTSAEALAIIQPRLARMQALTASRGVQLIVIAPPIPQAHQDLGPVMVAATRALHLPLIMPYTYRDIAPNLFLDDVHLTPEGATHFTLGMAPVLAKAVGIENTTQLQTASDLERNQPQPAVVGVPATISETRRP